MEKGAVPVSQDPQSNRRDFLSGRAALRQAEAAAAAAGEAFLSEAALPQAPSAGDRLVLATRAMNCEFAVMLDASQSDDVPAASEALDLVHRLEEQMTVYRATSEMSQLNAAAFDRPVAVEGRLFALLQRAKQISEETGEAFDPTSGPLIALWRDCRRQGRIPTQDEIDAARERTGLHHVMFYDQDRSLRFDRSGVELNLGAIGKGEAIDRIGEQLVASGVERFLLHGGQSSILARGDHHQSGGWPVGLRNPVFPTQPMATLLLRDEALSTSGAGEQFYRYDGKRYGHLIDPRNGWPAEGMLSATVLAETAAEADALSTAFFVGGVEIARRYCDNHPKVRALMTPPLGQGRQIEIRTLNVPDGSLFPAPDCLVVPL